MKFGEVNVKIQTSMLSLWNMDDFIERKGFPVLIFLDYGKENKGGGRVGAYE